MEMRLLGETIEQLRNELNLLMQKETIWCSGKVLSLSQRLDILIANHYISDKSA
jgi:hypothetical protein